MPDRKMDIIEKKALLIEYDEGYACLIEEILADQDIDVVRSKGGREAIDILSGNDFPVVITNLEMRDIDGFGIIDYLKKKKKNCLVIVMTDHASIDSVIVAMRLGAYDYIIKPFDREFFRNTVFKAFDFIYKRENQERMSQVGLIAELATTMSHEVFQPLTVLMGLAHEIQRKSEERAVVDMAAEILIESRKIRDIIRKMDTLDPYATKEFPGGHVIIDIEKGKHQS